MKKIILAVIVITLFATVFFLIKHFSVSEKEQVRQTLNQAVRAIKERNVPKLLTFFSADYTDELGNTKGTLFFFLRNIFNEYKNLYLYTSGLKIEIDKKEAKAIFIATVLTHEKGEPIREIIKERDRILVKLRKEGNSWKIIRAEEAVYTFE